MTQNDTQSKNNRQPKADSNSTVTEILDGKALAAERRAVLKARVQQFTARAKRPPGLAVVLVGDNPASHVYVKSKVKTSIECGFESFHVELPSQIEESQLKSVIRDFNQRSTVDGILVQLPLPKALSEERVLGAIDPKKDPDGLTIENLGLLFAGRKRVAPCTPAGVIELLKRHQITLESKSVLVIGRSNIVGKPMAQLALEQNATVTIAHSKTPNLKELTRRFDVVIAAAGQPRFLGRDDFRPGAIVVDVGIHRVDGKLCGDVRSEELMGYAAAFTPVPGGVGPMTIQMLLENTLTLAEAHLAESGPVSSGQAN